MNAGPGTLKVLNKTSIELYRDCLRLVRHIAGNSRKANQINKIIRNEFQKNASATDEDLIASLKANAVRGLANYLMIEASSKDKRLSEQSNIFNSRESDSIKKGYDKINAFKEPMSPDPAS